MAEEKTMRLSQVARKLNVSTTTIVDFLGVKGISVEASPNAKIDMAAWEILVKEFESSAQDKVEASNLNIGGKKPNESIIAVETVKEERQKQEEEEEILIKNAQVPVEPKPEVKEVVEKQPEEVVATTTEEQRPDGAVKLQGIKVLGKIDLDAGKKKPVSKEKPKTEKPKVEKVEPKVEAKLVTKVEEKPEVVEEKKPELVAEVKTEEPVITAPEPEVLEKEIPVAKVEERVIEAKADALKGLTVLGKIQLPTEKKSSPRPGSEADKVEKKKRARLAKGTVQVPVDPRKAGDNRGPQQRGPNQARPNTNRPGQGQRGPAPVKKELTEKEIQDKIKDTLAKLSGGNTNKNMADRARYRKEKRRAVAEADVERKLQEEEDAKILKVTEFISASDLASLMEVGINEVIKVCLSMGMFVSINQRLDAEAITVIADEFGYEIKFMTTEDDGSDDTDTIEDDPEDLEPRAPIVTIMGHVDHGKTSLLDYIRKSKVAAKEAGGITQHIGAYDVKTDSGKQIAFLDTPGHEAFTAMRARGAKLTDIVIIVVAADDNVMPQTKEAINHALVAGVPIVIAINKMDKPAANPDRIKEELSKENILVEDWGGKYQCEPISAKTGQGIPELLDKVLLEAEILNLKANPNRLASGSVVEAALDKGRGYVATIMVQTGTLEVGDVVLAGANFGKIKAMVDHRGIKVKKAGPSTPVQILGLNGAPQAGDKFVVMAEEREAREIATKREQLLREQSIRTKKHITLDEIGRRLAIGNFKELNIIVKGDVDGSVEALSDSLLKLSTEEIQIRILHKGVGPVSESDVLLASASDAIVVGFNVRPSSNARKLAENEQIEIRMYSIIYDAINEVKDAMEGMLAPTSEEVILGNLEVRNTFKISKIGTVAGCYVLDGHIKRNSKVRLIRDGIVVHTGDLAALKRFKEDVSEVKYGYECGLSLRDYNDIREGDNIEPFEIKEIKRTL
jgi:translation initiation factor IF-2